MVKASKEMKLIQEDLNAYKRPFEKHILNPEIDPKPSRKIVKKKNQKSRNQA
jgi:hypothetical protein